MGLFNREPQAIGGGQQEPFRYYTDIVGEIMLEGRRDIDGNNTSTVRYPGNTVKRRPGYLTVEVLTVRYPGNTVKRRTGSHCSVHRAPHCSNCRFSRGNCRMAGSIAL